MENTQRKRKNIILIFLFVIAIIIFINAFLKIKSESIRKRTWQKTFGDENDDWGNSVQQTKDGGFIITGYTSSFGAGRNDVYLIKTDKNGNAKPLP